MQKAETEKPSKYSFTFKGNLQRLIFSTVGLLLIFQLLGLNIWPFAHNIFIQLVGFILVLIGITISILGRHDLGTNWTHGANYQIKKDQEMIESGIYRYIRHPIYSGLVLAFIGGQLVAESYLAIFFFFICLSAFCIQSKKEEVLLTKHFGKKYIDYMHRTKMFIPFVI